MNNKMDWEVLQKVADYQVLKGGDVGKDFRTLLDSKTATFYDDRGAKLSEERLMPLLRHYLRDGIDGRTDRKNVESLLTYMGQLTTASPSSIDFSGDKDLKKYVEVGGDFKTGSSYDSKWFTDSIDATVGAVETNLSYLESVKMGLSPAQRMDCDTMIERYTSMRDRVRKLEDTCPESQKTVVDNMKELIRRVQSNRTNIETGAYHLDVIGTTSDNIFKVTDDLIKKSETVVTNPPKGAKKLSDSECGFNIIRKEKDSSFIRNIVVKEYRESIRAMINAIEDDFAQQKADLVTMQTQKKELLQTKSLVAANFDELEKQLNNGQIEQWEFNDAEFELSQKYEMAEQELNTITQDYQNESMRYSNLSLTWKTLKFKIEQLLSESKTAVLTENRDTIIESMTRFKGYILNMEGENGEYTDFSVMQTFIENFQTKVNNLLVESGQVSQNVRDSIGVGRTNTAEQMQQQQQQQVSSFRQKMHARKQGSPTETIRPTTAPQKNAADALDEDKVENVSFDFMRSNNN